MPLDPGKQRKILVVHGVQTGDNDQLHQDELVRNLFSNRKGDIDIDYEVVLYKYENLNNQVLDKLQDLAKRLITHPVGALLAPSVIDIVGDVVISLANGSTANKIRTGLRDMILNYYDNGHPCYVVAHSLGTVYSFDVLNELMTHDEYFSRDSRLNWPVMGWLTMGSPLGLDMFKASGRNTLTELGTGDRVFPWRNYYDPNDPVVSGNIFGIQLGNEKIAEAYLSGNETQGWYAKDFRVNTGKIHLAAHTAYWETSSVGDGIVAMLSE